MPFTRSKFFVVVLGFVSAVSLAVPSHVTRQQRSQNQDNDRPRKGRPFAKFIDAFTPTGNESGRSTQKRKSGGSSSSASKTSSSSKASKSSSGGTRGSPKRRAFVSNVLSYQGKVDYSYGAESYPVLDCSSFVQYVLEKKGCADIPGRLTSSGTVNGAFGSPKSCELGDIVAYNGHMGFYYGPGQFVGNNAGSDGVSVHRSSGRCYENPCL